MPQYRTTFFANLSAELRRHEIELHVFYGDTPKEWKERNDSSQPLSMLKLPTRFIQVGNRTLSYKNLSQVRRSGPYDLLVVEQAIRNIETYELLARRGIYDRIAYWGHGRTYTAPKSKFEEGLKVLLTKNADWFFGYTQGGVEAMVKNGYSHSKTTVVQNSIDSQSLRDDLQSITPEQIDAFRLRHDLTHDTALYIGGIDEAKRIPFLLDAAERVYDRNRNFRLVIVGEGSLAKTIRDKSTTNPWVVHLGSLFGAEKALALTSARVLAIPGRVGLVAVDSLVAGKPIITTRWPFHAPEFEYLKHDHTMLASADDLDCYADTLHGAFSDDGLVERLSRNCRNDGIAFTAESMAIRFTEGIVNALSN
ncbi:glycosyltransferase family 4 protein [Rhodococcus opacus]|nr:glycosyltransferase family 4 protein [Rhodococcus opacus]